MKIYTGYFAKVKSYREAGLTTVSIARFKPKFYAGLQYPNLAPTPKMLKMTLGEYDVAFKRILSYLSAKQVAAEIEVLTSGKDAILLCYERIGEYCHRHLVADWLNANGIEVKEWLPPVIEEPKLPEQGLFEF